MEKSLTEDPLFRAFALGFAASSEGCNGECAFSSRGIMPLKPDEVDAKVKLLAEWPELQKRFQEIQSLTQP
jgi:hypothetical protein